MKYNAGAFDLLTAPNEFLAVTYIAAKGAMCRPGYSSPPSQSHAQICASTCTALPVGEAPKVHLNISQYAGYYISVGFMLISIQLVRSSAAYLVVSSNSRHRKQEVQCRYLVRLGS